MTMHALQRIRHIRLSGTFITFFTLMTCTAAHAVETPPPAQAASTTPVAASPKDPTQEEANRKAQQELIAQQKAQKLAAIKAAKEEEAKERIRQQEALELQCVIKPAMSDDEIATCKSVWR